MRRLSALIVVAAVSLTATAARAQFDSVRVDGGKGSEAGNVTSVSKTTITVAKGAGGARKVEVPVNRVHRVTFAGEPTELSQARVNVYNGGFENAASFLEEIDISTVSRPEVKTDIEYYKAYAEAQKALSGSGDLDAAQTQMFNFVKNNLNSFHYYEACEVLGDLAVASNDYPKAVQFYEQLEKTAWPDFQIRAKVLVGRVLQSQNNHSAAIAKFEEALATAADSDEAESQKLAATLGKAVSMSQTGQLEQAVSMIDNVLAAAGPEQKNLHARAYNALGTCHLKAGKVKPAMLAFLRTHLLYNVSPEAHAEALYHLHQLFNQQGQEDRARDMLALLKDRYGSSTWAQK